MDLLVNDLSVQEQFQDTQSFLAALNRLMAIRGVARRFQRDVYCNRALLNARPIQDVSMQQVIARITDESKRRSAMIWLTRGGPFWDDDRRHGEDDYLECRNYVVTDTAIGEAAYCRLHRIDRGLTSFSPSDWTFSPVEVDWVFGSEGLDRISTSVENWLTAADLENKLRNAGAPIQSWGQLELASIARFQRLAFSPGCFEHLRGVPFATSSAERIVRLLDVLERFSSAFDMSGKRTPEGQRIYQDYFTGDRAWFSDSSCREKRKFRDKLTFPHPEDEGSVLFCPWHGKESRQTLRLHYSWSMQAGDQVFIVYIGPKITKS